jgi:glycosyltransferase involved in cell wall biosynthesis
MKFSFLIPSKDRLELLHHAVESLLRQSYRDFEIVIADNASGQDYTSYIRRLNDPRIVYRRYAGPAPVTDNWNRALAAATGDYVLMLGDDDALAPGAAARIAATIADTAAPDIVYLAAYHYCYPGAIPSAPSGYLAAVVNSSFFDGHADAPFAVPPETARAVAEAAFAFRYHFGFNSQHFVFRAGFLADVAAWCGGTVFQSPYPDTFAAVVSFLCARSIVAIPDPAILIGISPKSFGHFYFTGRIEEGRAFLANDQLSPDVRRALAKHILPGDVNNTNWLVAVEAARRALAPRVDLSVDIDRYRMLQVIAFLRQIYLDAKRTECELDVLTSLLTPAERIACDAILAAVEAAVDLPHLIRIFEALDRRLAQFWPARVTMLDIGPHSSIDDAVKWLDSREA